MKLRRVRFISSVVCLASIDRAGGAGVRIFLTTEARRHRGDRTGAGDGLAREAHLHVLGFAFTLVRLGERVFELRSSLRFELALRAGLQSDGLERVMRLELAILNY